MNDEWRRRDMIWIVHFLSFFFFFFQAEDGIRDHCVTGVQTCALPISRRPGVEWAKVWLRSFSMRLLHGNAGGQRGALLQHRGEQCSKPEHYHRSEDVV